MYPVTSSAAVTSLSAGVWVLTFTWLGWFAVGQSANATCQGNWCFYWDSRSYNWTQAESLCMHNETHLASIESLNASVLLSTAYRDVTNGNQMLVWLGGRAVQGDYHWVSDADPLALMGCYDIPVQFDRIKVTEFRTPRDCLIQCTVLSHTYATLHMNNSQVQCNCMNYTNSAYPRSISTCNQPCQKSIGEKCRGNHTELVYRTGNISENWTSYNRFVNDDFLPKGTFPSCIAMNGAYNFTWTARNCSDVLHFVCVSNLMTKEECEALEGPGYKYLGEECVWLSHSHNLTASFDRAMNECSDRNFHLVKITDELFHRRLRENLFNLSYWIGLTNTQWTWSNGKNVKSYMNWQVGHPGTNKMCMAADVTRNLTWVSVDCSEQLTGFVCENRTSGNWSLISNLNNTLQNVTTSNGSRRFNETSDKNEGNRSSPISSDIQDDTSFIIGLSVGLAVAVVVILSVTIALGCRIRQLKKQSNEQEDEKGEKNFISLPSRTNTDSSQGSVSTITTNFSDISLVSQRPPQPLPRSSNEYTTGEGSDEQPPQDNEVYDVLDDSHIVDPGAEYFEPVPDYQELKDTHQDNSHEYAGLREGQTTLSSDQRYSSEEHDDIVSKSTDHADMTATTPTDNLKNEIEFGRLDVRFNTSDVTGKQERLEKPSPDGATCTNDVYLKPHQHV